MRTILRLLSVVAVGLGALALGACEPSPPTAIATTTTIGCGFGTLSADTDWYLPAGTPKGLVWLQHGFTESKSDWGSFAPQLATQGYAVFVPTLPTANIYGCTVENVGNNTAFLDNVAGLFAGASNPNGSLATSFSAAATKAGRPGLALPTRMAFSGHSAGGEAVLYVADRLRRSAPTTFARLGGLVLADPVTSLVGANTESSLAGLAGTTVPVYAIASPPYSCNSNQSGTVAVEQGLAARPFHGVQITTGAHGDIFGSSANSVENTTCGTPQAKNVAAAQQLAAWWLADEVAGTHSPADYPGGAAYESLVSAGTVTTLP